MTGSGRPSRFADLVEEAARVRAASVELIVIIVFIGLLLGAASNLLFSSLERSSGLWYAVGWGSLLVALLLAVVAAHRSSYLRRLDRSERWDVILPLCVASGRFEVVQPAGHHASRVAAEALARTTRARPDFVEIFTREWVTNLSAGGGSPLRGGTYAICTQLVQHLILRALAEHGKSRFTSTFRYHGPHGLTSVGEHEVLDGARLSALGSANHFDEDWLRAAPTMKLRVSPGGVVTRLDASEIGAGGIEIACPEGVLRVEIGRYWTPLHDEHRTSRIVVRRSGVVVDDSLWVFSIPVMATLSLRTGWRLVRPSTITVWLQWAESFLLHARQRLDWSAYDEHEIERTILDLEHRLDAIAAKGAVRS